MWEEVEKETFWSEGFGLVDYPDEMGSCGSKSKHEYMDAQFELPVTSKFVFSQIEEYVNYYFI